MKIVTIERGREVAAAQAERIRVEASYSVRAGNMVDEMERERSKPIHAPDRTSVKRAMLAVEANLVAALWTMARLGGDNRQQRHGIRYYHEAIDQWANAVDNGGRWEEQRPRAPLPSPKAIDAIDEPMSWLAYLQPEQAKLVSTAASTKCGEIKRRVSWRRVRAALPHTQTQSIRTLQRRYDDGIRTIVAHLTERTVKTWNS